jgi:hypothetical protein
MAKYTVVTARRVDQQLVRHIQFLSRVSVPAAKRFRNEYADILECLERNPLQFPLDTDPNLPDGLYHKALFARWHKALFLIEADCVYLDAVVDCRQSIDSLEL